MNQSDINKRALRAGLWYTICNFLARGINFLTTPFFTRLMSKGEYGSYSNFASWLSLLTILTTLDLYTSISRAKYDYKDNINEYVASVQLLGTLATIISYIFVCMFPSFFTKLFDMDMFYIHIMFFYMMVSPAFTLLQSKHRQYMKYKTVTILSLTSTILSVLISLILVLNMDDKFLARVIGGTGVLIGFYLIIYLYNLYKSKYLMISCWKYGLSISLPLIIHVLSNNILGTSDRIIINNYCGSEKTALYSVVYSCSQIATMLFNSINQAWSPWFYEKLNQKEYSEINHATKYYIVISSVVVIILMLLGPEIIFIFGGTNYMESIYIVPCILLGCFYWVLYTFFINTEIFYKKTLSISVRTMVGALINTIGNIIFIPIFGWQAAAYTTLIGYYLLFILHSLAGKKLGTDKYFNQAFFYKVSVIMFFIMIIIRITYNHIIFRIMLIIVAIFTIILFCFKKRNKINNLISKKISK